MLRTFYIRESWMGENVSPHRCDTQNVVPANRETAWCHLYSRRSHNIWFVDSAMSQVGYGVRDMGVIYVCVTVALVALISWRL